MSQIERLCLAIEVKIGRPMKTSNDFDYLAEVISEETHQSVSPVTLKRLWGFQGETEMPRISILDSLSQFVGYDDWDAFCLYQTGNTVGQKKFTEPVPGADDLSWQGKSTSFLWGAFAVLVVAVLIVLLWGVSHETSISPNSFVLEKGQKFSTYHDYLRLFGIADTTAYWGKVLPHHPNIVVWGPEYHHSHWHNEGNRDNLMPTITEHWAPADVDSVTIAMRNSDKYHHELRINEVRITFMKNLVDSSYVFLGVYRLSLAQSNVDHCVWERVAEKCDLNNLDYLEELRN